MTALGSVLRRRFSCSFGWCESGRLKFRDGAQHLAAMPQQNAEVLEVLLCQVAEDRKINGVIAEPLRVLTQADRCEPLGNAFHGTSHRPAGGCCARATSGQAAAAPPSSVMNWRRFTSSMGSSPEPAVPAYRRLRMYRKRPLVLEADLNRSESVRGVLSPRRGIRAASRTATSSSRSRGLPTLQLCKADEIPHPR